MGREEARQILLAQRTPVIEACKGCNRIDGELCSTYLFPDKRWRLGDCGLATHVVEIAGEQKEKVRVGQQKTKKFRLKK